MIHPTAIIGADPSMYPRAEDGYRPAREHDFWGVSVLDDVDVGALAIVVNGTQHPTVVMPGCRILHRAHVGHDCVIDVNTIVGVGAVLCGFVEVGARCTIGAGAVICPEVKIGDDCFIGAGVTVYVDLPPNTKITQTGIRRNWENLPWRGE